MGISYYEDFYDEPSEFERKIDEFKSSLLESIRSEYKAEMERLRKENAELQEVKKRIKEIEREREREKTDLEEVKRKAVDEAKKKRLADLLKDYKEIVYGVKSFISVGPKCDKCDSDRKISYKTPMGRDAKENCTCADKIITYKPREAEATSLEHRSADGKVEVNYYDPDNDRFITLLTIYDDGMDYQDINKYSIYFETEEECQKYCDWLNQKYSEKK